MPTQAGRPIRVASDLGTDALLLERIQGEEALSTPFRFTLDLLSDRSIDPASMLRKPLGVVFDLSDGSARHVHGRVSRFALVGKHGALSAYRAEVVPAFWFATLASDWRIFQDKTVKEIVEHVLQGASVPDFEWRLSGNYKKREYCVQFGETNLAFVSRLLEEEGIYYYFVHEQGRHVMVMGDAPSGFEDCPGPQPIRVTGQPPATAGAPDVVLELAREASVHTAAFALRDFDYLAPAQPVEASMDGQGEARYEYPGGFKTRGDGDRYARIRMEEQEALRQTVTGRGLARALFAGGKFAVSEHFQREANRKYVAVSVRHQGHVTGYRAGETVGAQYENAFVAIPDDAAYRPPRRTPKPQVRGAQTALVVGKSGEEIWVDAHGRVKVKFHWDRAPGKDEKSSCWVRVASSWAGKGWGALQLPRVGQEVVVEFLDGDPDRPLIIGSVYNATQTPPYAPGSTPWMSGLRTRSTKQGGDKTYSELAFSDEKGKERVLLHAERDLALEVENDETHTVGHDRKVTVKSNDARIISEGNDDLTVEKGNHTVSVAKGHATVNVDTGNHVLNIKKGNRQAAIDTGNDEVVLKTGNQTVTAKVGNITTKAAAGKVTIEALQGIELKVGQSKITIDQSGITITGMMVKLDGKVQTSVNGTMTEVKASGILTVKGTLTMIN